MTSQKLFFTLAEADDYYGEGAIILWNQKNKSYIGFQTHKQCADYIEKRPRERRTFHEVIRGNQRFKMDIDIKFDSADYQNADIKPTEDCITEIRDAIETTFRKLFTKEDLIYGFNAKDLVLVFVSSCSYKISFHIVVSGYYFKNHKQTKFIYEQVKKHIRPELHPYLDSTYGKTQNFRCLTCTKPDENRPFLIPQYGRHVTLEQSFVTYIQNNIFLDLILEEDIRQDEGIITGNTTDIITLLNIIAMDKNHIGYYARLNLITAIKNTTNDIDIAEEFINMINPDKIHQVAEKWSGLNDTRLDYRFIYMKASRVDKSLVDKANLQKPDRFLSVEQLNRIIDINKISPHIDLEDSYITYNSNIIEIKTNDNKTFYIHPLTGIYENNGKLIHSFNTSVLDYNAVNCKYLDIKNPVITDILTKFFDIGGILAVKSPLGSGKTRLLCDLFNNDFKNMKILNITCRISLAQDLHRKFDEFGFEIYTNKNIKCSEQDKLLLQFDSLRKLLKNKTLIKYDVIVIDEIVSLLHHMMNDNLRLDIVELYNQLCVLIKNCKYCVMLDGMINDDVIDIIKDFGRPITKLYNIYKNPSPTTIHFEKSKKLMFKQINESLAQNKKIVIISSSIAQTDTIKNNLPDNVIYDLPEDREEGYLYARVYNGKSGKEITKDLLDVNATWQKLDILIYTSKIGCGVDFDSLYFDEQYVFITGHTSPMPMWCQMLKRVRNLTSNKIVCNISYVGTNNLKYYIKEMTMGDLYDDRVEITTPLQKIKRYYDTVIYRSNHYGRPYFIQALHEQNYIISNGDTLIKDKTKINNKFNLYAEILEKERPESLGLLCKKAKDGETTYDENLTITREMIQRQYVEGHILDLEDVKLLYHKSNIDIVTRLRIFMLHQFDTIDKAIHYISCGQYEFMNDAEQRNNIVDILEIIKALDMKPPTINKNKTFEFYEFTPNFKGMRQYFENKPIQKLYSQFKLGRCRRNIDDAENWGYKDTHLTTINKLLNYMGFFIKTIPERVRWYDENKKPKEKTINKYSLSFFSDNLDPIILRDYADFANCAR
jgi:hypothetical protein